MVTERLSREQVAELGRQAAAVFLARGATPLREGIALLRGWGLSGGQAAEVLAHGMARGLFVLSPRDATLRPPRRSAFARMRAAIAALKEGYRR